MVSVVSVLCQCGCVHYLQRVLVMPEISVSGEAKEISMVHRNRLSKNFLPTGKRLFKYPINQHLD